MKFTLLAGALLLALLPPIYLGAVAPAHAQDAQLSCLWNLDQTVPLLKEKNVVIDEADAIKALIEMLVGAGEIIPEGAVVSRVLLAYVDGMPYYGLEIGGLLCAPKPFPVSLVFPVTLRLSGRYAFGTFA